MSELRKLREAVYNLATDEDEVLTDEVWYDQLWELLDPVIDARAERQLAAAVNTVADETRDPATGQPTSTEAPSPRGSMTFAQAEALLVEYQREKLERQARERG